MGGLGARTIVGFVQAVLSREPAILETLGKRDVAAVRGENLPGKRLKGAEGTYLLLNVVALQHRLLQDVLGPAARVRRSGRGCAYTSLTLLRRSVCDSVETTRTATRSARRRRMTNVSTKKVRRPARSVHTIRGHREKPLLFTSITGRLYRRQHHFLT